MRKYAIQVHLDSPLINWIRLESKRLGVSIGAVVRDAIQKKMSEGEKK